MDNLKKLFIGEVDNRLVHLPKAIPTSYVVKLLKEFNKNNEFQVYRREYGVSLIADEDCTKLALALFNKAKSDFPELAKQVD